MSNDEPTNRASRRAKVLAGHLLNSFTTPAAMVDSNACLSYSPPELSEKQLFDTREMRQLLDGHNLEDRDWMFGVFRQERVFNPKILGGRVFVSPDYNQSMEQQRDMTMRRIACLLEKGVFRNWLGPVPGDEEAAEWKKLAMFEVIGMYDHSLAVKILVHVFLWGGAIQYLGTKIHQDKWLHDTETYAIKGCFAMTELGHGSNVRGIETITTYDPETQEFVINTPCESAQKYWIGGAANHATHTVVFSQLHIAGKSEGVHAFICPLRDNNGNILPNIRISDCGHKIGLNGVDNGSIWFDNMRVPRDHMLNSVAEVSPDGSYLSSIKDQDQRFAAFLSPLTSGRVTIAASAVYQSKIALAIAIRYGLSRRAFSLLTGEPEVLLLDYPSHQMRLFPLLAKTYAMSFAANYLKKLYVRRTPQTNKTLHVVSSAFKATLTWHNMRTLQECREACGGQGIKTENRIGCLHGEHDVQSTFEGDNNVLMQQVSKGLFAEVVACKKKKKPFAEMGLEHLNGASPEIPLELTESIVRRDDFQYNMMCLRERNLLTRFVEEIEHLQSKGGTKASCFVERFHLAEELGRAFSERAILATMMREEAGVGDVAVRRALTLMRWMYALVCMEEDGSFLRYGYLSAANAAVIRREVQKLCAEIRPHALALVSSFGIPDAFLSPIAYDWVAANSLSPPPQPL